MQIGKGIIELDCSGRLFFNAATMKKLTTLFAALVLCGASLRAEDGLGWELSVGGGVRQLELQFDTKATASFQHEPLQSSESKTVGFPSIELRKELGHTGDALWRFGLGYNYSQGKWDTGEHEAGEGPDELYTLDITKFTVNAHQISALFDVSWKVNASWEIGLRFGPTLTFYDGEFKGSHETFQENDAGTSGAFITGHVRQQSATKTAVGVSGEAFARYNIPNSRTFIEVRAGGQWTDSVSFGDSAISARLKGGTWQAGVSVGFKF